MATSATTTEAGSAELVKGLRLFDATTLVMGSMIGSGIFIVSADVARQVGTPGLLLAAWAISGLMTVIAAVSYGELAAMMPRAGVLDGYPSDGYQRLASRLTRFSKPLQTDYGIRLLIAPGRENGAEGDIVCRR